MTDAWEYLAQQMKVSLTEPPNDGPVLEAEVDVDVGASSLDIIVESVSGGSDEQVGAYGTLCDLLSTRLAQGSDQVLGCLLTEEPADAEAFAGALVAMERPNGVFTPVLPLDATQASDLIKANVLLLDLLDSATSLIEVAASRKPITRDVAETALSEIDELIARATEPV